MYLAKDNEDSEPKQKNKKHNKKRKKISKTHRLFISHSWTYSDAYEKVIKMISEQGISFYDHSVPRDNPIHNAGSDKELEAAIDAKIKGTSCVLIMAGKYSTYSKWINKEIAIAKKYNKPIIAIRPWATLQASSVVQENASEIVNWQGSSIVNAIKKWS